MCGTEMAAVSPRREQQRLVGWDAASLPSIRQQLPAVARSPGAQHTCARRKMGMEDEEGGVDPGPASTSVGRFGAPTQGLKLVSGAIGACDKLCSLPTKSTKVRPAKAAAAVALDFNEVVAIDILWLKTAENDGAQVPAQKT